MHDKGESQPLNAGLSDLDGHDTDVESIGFIWEKAKSRGPSARQIFALIAAFSFSIIISGFAGAYVSARFTDADTLCAAHTSRWSPLLKDVDVKYSVQTFNGDFMNENIYRRQGSPEVDAAWEALGVDRRAGVISYEDGVASGLNSSFVQRAEKYGGGFFVHLEGMHHLHCLNLVRKSLYFNFEHYKAMGMHAFQNDDDILRLHVTHCLDTVRQVLMCNVDTSILGQVWVNSDKPTAFPDFNTRHMCKNFDAIKAWAGKVEAAPNDELPSDYMAQPDPEDILPYTP